ncbi:MULTISPECIES: amidase family protein [unclassified Leucobacter]|uniref:amidase family protein n=1 Tax=unclassified Leucobacter TaxID=2621730 RepID=UPI0030163229
MPHFNVETEAAVMSNVNPIAAPDAATWTQLADRADIAAQLDALPASAPDTPFALAVKANIAVRGFRRSAACPVFDTAAAPADAAIVAQLRRAGAVVVGTTNMHELAFGVTSRNAAFGAVEVPGHPGHSAGGSSGGSAAAVAGGAVELALGTDTGGSVSIPAAHCGIVGFRPSTGRWSTDGILGLSTTRDTPGIFCRTVSEADRIDRIVVNDTRPATTITRPARLGLPEQLRAQLHPATRAAFDAALTKLDEHFELVPIDYAEVLQLCDAAEAPLVMWESRRLLGDAAARALALDPVTAFKRLINGVASDDVRAILQAELRSPTTPEAYALAQARTLAARETATLIHDAMRVDALLFPTAPAPAPPLDTGGTVTHFGQQVPLFPLYTRNTAQGTILGAPMVTLPVPVTAGALPVGITLQGRRFDDRRTLGLAHIIEAALAGA